MQERTCIDCDESLGRPIAANANYVVSDRFVDNEPVEVLYAMVHTSETKPRLNKINRLIPDRDRQALSAEIAHPEAPEEVEVDAGTKTRETEGGETETADLREMPFSVAVEKFDHVDFEDIDHESANDVHDDDDIAFVYDTVEERPVQKTGLVCPDCTEDGDHIMWGPDKPE